MTPPERVVVAAVRWIDLLRRNTAEQAWALLSSDPHYIDLTETQYLAALTWLKTLGIVALGANGSMLAPGVERLRDTDLRTHLLAVSLIAENPPWLEDSTELIRDETELTEDVLDAAATLGLAEDQALVAVRRASSKVDLEARKEIGDAGERVLLNCLNQLWPGRATHVASYDDSAGFDIALETDTGAAHIEVKSTTRRGRLRLFLSRNEFEISKLDPLWCLAVVGLGDSRELGALASCAQNVIASLAPDDSSTAARWESARFELTVDDLEPGLVSRWGRLIEQPRSQMQFAWAPTSAREPKVFSDLT